MLNLFLDIILMKKSKSIRMCIVCRSRYPQRSLIRLKQAKENIVPFDGKGRCFYLCTTCVTNEKKVNGLVKRFKQDKERFSKLLQKLHLKVHPLVSSKDNSYN